MNLPLNLISAAAKHGTFEDVFALDVLCQYIPQDVQQVLKEQAPMNVPLAEIPGEDWVKLLVAAAQAWALSPPAEGKAGITSLNGQEKDTSVTVRKCPKCNQFFLEE